MEPTPHRSEFVADACVALSHKGRGRSNGRRRKENEFGRRNKMPIKYDELMALKNLGQKYAYTDREV
ncbi:MAG: hypothetical protein WAV72_28540, partial [Bradyrhizobium sp.]